VPQFPPGGSLAAAQLPPGVVDCGARSESGDDRRDVTDLADAVDALAESGRRLLEPNESLGGGPACAGLEEATTPSTDTDSPCGLD